MTARIRLGRRAFLSFLCLALTAGLAVPAWQITSRGDTEQVAAETANNDAFKNWLLTGTNLELLELCIESAPVGKAANRGQWQWYDGLRSYGWQFRRLKNFYARVFPGE